MPPKPLPFPAGPFGVVYADPPWSYEDTRGTIAAAAQYSTMPTEAIAALPVRSIVAEDALLFLWATSPLLEHAFPVVEGWGFSYRTIAYVWIKRTPTGVYASIAGNYTQSNVEVCLIAARGKPTRVVQDVTTDQLVFAERGRHSAKPDEVRRRIEILAPDANRIELFARERHRDWSSWGDQLPPPGVFAARQTRIFE